MLGNGPPRARSRRASRWGHCRFQAGQFEHANDTARGLLDDQQPRVLGADHPDTLTTRFIVAVALAQSQLAEALIDLRGLLDDQLRILGAEDPRTFSTNLLAAGLAQQGRVEDALTAFRGLLEDEMRILGADHPVTAAMRDALSELQAADGHG